MFNMTVEQLLEFIKTNNIPMDAKVCYQRIEDSYFKPGTGWGENSIMKSDQYNLGEDQYVKVFTAVKYPDDKNLYLTAHY